MLMGILCKKKISRPLAHFPDGHSLQGSWASSCGGELFNNIQANRRQNQFTVVGLQNVEVKNISFRNGTLPHFINYGPEAKRLIRSNQTTFPPNSVGSHGGLADQFVKFQKTPLPNLNLFGKFGDGDFWNK